MRSRFLTALSDLARLNRTFLSSTAFRADVQTLLVAQARGNAVTDSPVDSSVASVASAYAGLTPVSLALCARGPTSPTPAIKLVLAEFDPQRVFAGIHTALRVAGALASSLNLSLQVLVVSSTAHGDASGDGAASVAERSGLAPARVSVHFADELSSVTSHEGDVWIVTHWTTAHAALVACRAGLIKPTQVLYLVQDYEPGFTPLSTDSVLAQSTYHEGFTLVVNSQPVARALAAQEEVLVDPELVFAPELPVGRLAGLAAARSDSSTPRVLFYGRPSKPRNLFPLGVAALKVAAAQLPSIPVEWVSAGEPHAPVALAPGHTLSSLGTLSWDKYFAELGRATVVLSLQASPHPSHPPLEAALSGARAVTNDVGGFRDGLMAGLEAVAADPQILGDAVAKAIRDPQITASQPNLGLLGRPLEAVVATLTERLS